MYLHFIEIVPKNCCYLRIGDYSYHCAAEKFSFDALFASNLHDFAYLRNFELCVPPHLTALAYVNIRLLKCLEASGLDLQ